MRFSQLFGETLREAPADVVLNNHRLLIRAAYMHQFGAGLFAYLHLGQLTIGKIEQIIKQDLGSLGGQEIYLPTFFPPDVFNLHKDDNPSHPIDPALTGYQGEMCMAIPGNQHRVVEMAQRAIHSYKQLPRLLFHLQRSWIDEYYSNRELLQLRQSEIFESIIIAGNKKDLALQYEDLKKVILHIFDRCKLPVIETKNASEGGEDLENREFYYFNPSGDEVILRCNHCGYTANRHNACIKKVPPQFEEAAAILRVATPQIRTIRSLADFLGVSSSKTAKAVFYIASYSIDGMGSEEFIFVVVRGDTEVNEHKLMKSLGAIKLRPATDMEIRQSGAVPGYASPIDIDHGKIVVDDLIPGSANLVAGANEEGFHLLNVNYGRDYKAGIVADITLAGDADPCPGCGEAMKAQKAICAGTFIPIVENDRRITGCTYQDRDGKRKPVVVGFYWMDIERLLGCIVEQHHDNEGLSLPPAIAPYSVHLVSLQGGDQAAEKIYADLLDKKIDVFFDDRDESAGVKFNDADLMGMPLRITVSARSLKNGGVEWKLRNQVERSIVPQEKLPQKILQLFPLSH